MVYAKKSLGQHFLRSERALNTIVEAAHLTKDDAVLEIGPGYGALTERLLAKAGRVIAVEKDDELVHFLKSKFPELGLVHKDILDYKIELSDYKLVANIPYNITGAILEKFLSAEYQPELMVLLVQKEVALRIVARDNKESILSISVKCYGSPKYVETVKAGSFSPAPKVDSAIISIENISKDFFTGFSEEKFFDMLHAGFKSKRKKLSSNLANIFDKEKVIEAFTSLHLDENTRAEDVSIGKWQELGKKLI